MSNRTGCIRYTFRFVESTLFIEHRRKIIYRSRCLSSFNQRSTNIFSHDDIEIYWWNMKKKNILHSLPCTVSNFLWQCHSFWLSFVSLCVCSESFVFAEALTFCFRFNLWFCLNFGSCFRANKILTYKLTGLFKPLWNWIPLGIPVFPFVWAFESIILFKYIWMLTRVPTKQLQNLIKFDFYVKR